MKHYGTVTLETARLVLRRATEDDDEAGFANYASDEEVTKFLTWPAYDVADLYRFYLLDVIRNYQNLDYYSWLIDLKGAGVVGAIAFTKVDEGTDTLYPGYVLGRNWWGQGIMTEALSRVIRFGFEDMEANRIACYHDVDNTRSGRVMQKCGMTFEGILRQAAYGNRGIVDICHYSILASEYFGS
ncbi:MAG: GNAT family N-acetyltransferase [Eggerthellaceae bacterium]|nr:GNAT family N-acetyltransferase [Eggerthellaceae bacterium]